MPCDHFPATCPQTVVEPLEVAKKEKTKQRGGSSPPSAPHKAPAAAPQQTGRGGPHTLGPHLVQGL